MEAPPLPEALPTPAPDSDRIAKLRGVNAAPDEKAGRARRILAKARSKTLEVQVFGETLTCRWMSVERAGRFDGAVRAFKEAAEKAGDGAGMAALVETCRAACRIVSDLVVEDDELKAFLAADQPEDGALDVAVEIVKALGEAMKAERAAVAAFRQK